MVVVLVALPCTCCMHAQSIASPVIAPGRSEAAVAGLPDAPSALGPAKALQQDEVRLPAKFQPDWAVERPKLGEKLRYGAASLVAPRTLLEALMIGGLPSFTRPPSQPVFTPGEPEDVYEGLMDAYGDQTNAWLRKTDTEVRSHGYRLEVGLATAETRQLLSNLVLPIALRQEAQYRPAPIDASLGARLMNAAESIVVTHNDHGRVVPNYSKLGGTVAAGFAGSMVYAPAVDGTTLNSGRFALKYTAYSLAGDLATNATRELLRDVVADDMQMYALHGMSMEDSYYPRSVGGKVLDWARSSYSLRTIVSAALLAGLPDIKKEPTEPQPNEPWTYGGFGNYTLAYQHWGNAELEWKDTLQSNVRMHERRLFGGLAETETQVLMEKLVVPVGLDIDARYIPLGPGYDAGTRLGHAFTSLAEARTDKGGRAVNLPVLVGTVGAAFAAKEFYYPRLGTPALETNAVLVETIGLNLALDLMGNVRAEFRRHLRYF